MSADPCRCVPRRRLLRSAHGGITGASPRARGDRIAAPADVAARLIGAWTDEVEATIVYELIARRESDPRRADVLRNLASIETNHRSRLEGRMRELGIEIPHTSTVRVSPWTRLQARIAPVDRLLARQEAVEQAIALEIDEQPTGDPGTDTLLDEIRAEEEQHTTALASLRAGTVPKIARPTTEFPPDVRLARILGRERWHRASGGWISSAIYGANDGLAAVFGLVAGFSGATGGSHLVLTAGLFGAIGSALSMATGAYLAERSTAEVAAANLAREHDEVLRKPQEEKEELSLFYQLKGLTAEEADMLVERIAEDPEKLFAAPTAKCATSDTTAAITTPAVPDTKKNGSTGMIAPTAVEMPPASAA